MNTSIKVIEIFVGGEKINASEDLKKMALDVFEKTKNLRTREKNFYPLMKKILSAIKNDCWDDMEFLMENLIRNYEYDLESSSQFSESSNKIIKSLSDEISKVRERLGEHNYLKLIKD